MQLRPLKTKQFHALHQVSIFATWPGEAGLAQTDEWNSGNVIDPEGHPLAALHLETLKVKDVVEGWRSAILLGSPPDTK